MKKFIILVFVFLIYNNLLATNISSYLDNVYFLLTGKTFENFLDLSEKIKSINNLINDNYKLIKTTKNISKFIKNLNNQLFSYNGLFSKLKIIEVVSFGKIFDFENAQSRIERFEFTFDKFHPPEGNLMDKVNFYLKKLIGKTDEILEEFISTSEIIVPVKLLKEINSKFLKREKTYYFPAQIDKNIILDNYLIIPKGTAILLKVVKSKAKTIFAQPDVITLKINKNETKTIGNDNIHIELLDNMQKFKGKSETDLMLALASTLSIMGNYKLAVGSILILGHKIVLPKNTILKAKIKFSENKIYYALSSNYLIFKN